MTYLLRLSACLFLCVSLNSFAIIVSPFSEIRLDQTTTGQDFFVEDNTTFSFTDSGGDIFNYGSWEDFYITFSSNNGLRLILNEPFEFEHHAYGMFDRLGIQVSNSGIESLQNFQSSPDHLATPWLQTSNYSTLPWDISFGGGHYASEESNYGYIFPKDNARAFELGLTSSHLNLEFSTIRFYFYSDGSIVDKGWDFTIMALESASPVPLPAGIYLFLSGLVGLGLMRGRNG